MDRFRMTLLAFLLASTWLGALPALAQSREEKEVRAVLDRVFQAGSSLDEKVVKGVYNEYSASAGPIYSPFVASFASAAEVENYFNQLLPQLSERKFSTTSPVNVRADKNLAWANYTFHVEATFKDGTKRGFDARATVAFVREGKNWKIAHSHSSLVAAMPLGGAALEAEAQKIIQAERGAWEAVKTKQLAYFNDFLADDASTFEDEQAYRVRGKAEVIRGIEGFVKQGGIRSYQMADPQVQVLGDTALLTYYYSESGAAAGKEFSRNGKVTSVFVKQGGNWRALHAHFAANR